MYTLIENVWSSALGYILAQEKRPILVVTPHVNQVCDDLDFFYKGQVLDFPAWETLPDEDIAPNLDIVGKRLDILSQLGSDQIVVTSLQGALQKVPTKVTRTRVRLGALEFEGLQKTLQELDYTRVPIVADKGQFAVRGGIIDVFPINAMGPYRLEFFGDELEDIRTFDPALQTSTGKVSEFAITPAKESTSTATLFDYLPKDTLVVLDDLAALEDVFVLLKADIEPLFQGDVLMASPHTMEELSPGAFEMFGRSIEAKRMKNPVQSLDELFHGDFEALKDLPKAMQVEFVCSNASEERALEAWMPKMEAKARFVKGYLSAGLAVKDTVYFPYTAISTRPRQRRTQWRASYHTPSAEFHELSPGDYVVHFHNGVGKYLGTESRCDHTGTENDFMIIEYSAGSKLFVPLSQAHLISRYIGSKEEQPALNTLGTKKWHTAKVRAQKAIIGYAREMLELQAMRSVHGKTPYASDSEEMLLFEAAFPYVPTEDQGKAITDIKDDMQSDRVMDRLVCGDVGYGKTEVAMRAAFKTVIDGGKQVAVLVPTTVLALQHFESFCERMANFPVRIGQLSRFVPPKKVKETLAQLKEGSLDIVVGTHRLASSDIEFKDLGLIIIDEEQRFGVRVKERLKKFKAGIDCLTLSATPIPRTLYLSLTGGRDLSKIATPPQDRLPIKTIISERENKLIKNALMRELKRDGQAFFIHNRVETIFKVSDELQALVPQARILVAHGQMSADELDTVFHAFKSGEADILVATTLIENGIDIPNANTILIDRAHQFGLSDLYQLRGRVGRFNRAAYAYFLVPERRALPEVAQKRLQALVESSAFGGGMKLAMRDLEIRGSGDILGTQQSGHLSQIGFHLYCKLLKRAMHALKTKTPASFIETKMEFPFAAQLPSSYIPEAAIRLEIYHRLGDATDSHEVDKITSELTDRFGKPPRDVDYLLALTRIRIMARLRNFTVLRFCAKMLQTEQQRGKKVLKDTHKLPPIKSAKDLLTFCTAILQL